MSQGLRSGRVAQAAGLNVQTLRYYERRGLLAMPQRSNGGHRLYGEDAVVDLRVIKAAQRLGFTLEQVAGLLEAGRHRHGRPVAGLQGPVAAKLTEVEAKIADLATIRAALVSALQAGCDDLTDLAEEDPARPDPAADRRPLLVPKALGGLAAVAWMACCALAVRWWGGCPPWPWP